MLLCSRNSIRHPYRQRELMPKHVANCDMRSNVTINECPKHLVD
jgi:hypothetical protein